ncbi:hypothetical protein BH24ACT21_BH24ACT21_13420 [soil metagenome]
MNNPGASHAPFVASEYANRVAAIRAAMQERELDALLVSSPENIFILPA